jgi:hypothetical protein
MATHSELRMLLYRIREQLVAHPVFSRGSGVPVDDPAKFRELGELDRLSLQLSLIFRELKNKSNLLNVREQNLWNLPHKDRYRAAASVHSQQAEVADILELAREIQRLLEELLRKSGLIGEGELSQGIGEFIEKLYHQAHAHGEVQNMPDGLSYRSPGKGEFGGTVEGVTILVFVALRAFVYAAKRAGRNRSIGT